MNPQDKLDPRDKLRDLAISDSGFVFDPYSGSTFSLNASGRLILEGLVRGDDRTAITAHLQEHFAVAPDEDLDRDIDEFVNMARAGGLLPEDVRP